MHTLSRAGLSDYMGGLFLFFKCTSREVLVVTVTNKIVPAPEASFSFTLLAFLVCKCFESDVFDFSMVIYHCVILIFLCLILEVVSFRAQQDMETYTYSDIAQDLASFSKLSHELNIMI